jgi:hypothetical protein
MFTDFTNKITTYTDNVTLWRVIFLPTRQTKQPDIISLEESAFMVTLMSPATIKPI